MDFSLLLLFTLSFGICSCSNIYNTSNSGGYVFDDIKSLAIIYHNALKEYEHLGMDDVADVAINILPALYPEVFEILERQQQRLVEVSFWNDVITEIQAISSSQRPAAPFPIGNSASSWVKSDFQDDLQTEFAGSSSSSYSSLSSSKQKQ